MIKKLDKVLKQKNTENYQALNEKTELIYEIPGFGEDDEIEDIHDERGDPTIQDLKLRGDVLLMYGQILELQDKIREMIEDYPVS